MGTWEGSVGCEGFALIALSSLCFILIAAKSLLTWIPVWKANHSDMIDMLIIQAAFPYGDYIVNWPQNDHPVVWSSMLVYVFQNLLHILRLGTSTFKTFFAWLWAETYFSKTLLRQRCNPWSITKPNCTCSLWQCQIITEIRDVHFTMYCHAWPTCS